MGSIKKDKIHNKIFFLDEEEISQVVSDYKEELVLRKARLVASLSNKS